MLFSKTDKMAFFTKIILGVLVLTVFFSGIHTVVLGDSLVDIYSEIKSKYPSEINTMKRYGANETDIKKFIAALEEKLTSNASLTEGNINQAVADAVLDLFFSGEHDNVFDAVINGWKLSPEVLINAFTKGGTEQVLSLLPKSFLEIGRLVKERILTIPDEQEPSVPGGGDGGIPEEDTSIADSAKISSQITVQGDKVSVAISSSSGNSIALKGSDIAKIFAAGKSLEILTSKGDVVFTIPSNFLGEFKEVGIKVNAQKLTVAAADELTKSLNPEAKRVSAIYELSITSFSEGQSVGNFAHTINMTISYGESFLTLAEEDNLAVYRWDEANKKWVFIGGTIDKIKKTLSWPAFHFSKYTILSRGPVKTFSDIAVHWAKSDIEFLATRDIVNGVKEGIFEPNRRVTRAEFVKMLVNILNIETTDGGNRSFADVPGNAWYAPYVTAAYHAGLVKGVSETHFAPNTFITRQEMAVMAINSLKLKNKLAVQAEQNGAILDEFKDVAEIALWANEAFISAFENEIIQGRKANVLAPRDYTTRAESAVIIKRIFDKI